VSPGLLSLEPRKLLPGRLPFLAASDPVLGHDASSGQTTPMRLPVRAKLIAGPRVPSATGSRHPPWHCSHEPPRLWKPTPRPRPVGYTLRLMQRDHVLVFT